MSVTVQCPGCRNKFAAHERHAGRRVACKLCGESMQIPEPDAASRASWKIPFRCAQCGKSYILSSELAGKKMVCTRCGLKSLIPAGALLPSTTSEPVGSLQPVLPSMSSPRPVAYSPMPGISPPAPLSRHSLPTSLPTPPPGNQPVLSWDSDPELEPLTCDNLGMPPAPPLRPAAEKSATKTQAEAKPGPERANDGVLDIYGLDDPPPPPLEPAASETPNTLVSDTSDPLPARLGEYKPLSDAEKKKIRKRADRLDKLRSYRGATIGISFGTVLTIALFGWRMYRLLTIFKPDPDRNQIFMSAPGDRFDMNAFIAETDRQIAKQVAQPTTVEALEWLDPVKYPTHAVSEMSVPKARELITGFYNHGAQKVYAANPIVIGNTVLAHIVVKLPSDLAQRRQCFAWHSNFESGGDQPALDFGQQYLSLFEN